MALVISTNVASLNAQRKLTRNTQSLQVSFERLASGLRINSASDDAAGLAIGQRMTSQVRGLNQAIRNANDGSALAKTAEGALIETGSILQRMRELSVQAANDTNTTTDRAALQLEVDALTAEVDRISQQTQYNGLNLLDGTFSNRLFQIGANQGQTIALSIAQASTAVLGAVASVSTASVTTTAALANDLIVNGVSIAAPTAANDTVSSSGNANSAIAKAAAINAVSATTGVTATVTAAVLTDTGNAVAAGTYNAADLTINAVDIGAVTVLANDSDSALRNAINAISSQTGVVATLNTSNEMVLTAADGRNVVIAGAVPAGGGVTGLALGTTAGGLALESDSAISLAGTTPANYGLAAGSTAVNVAINISTQSIASQVNAGSAIGVFDSAIRQVATQRAELGAIMNRLDSAVASLSATSENVSASRSQVMDADFAAETAIYARNQILQQASAAMLAQANTSGQIALQLLGG